MSITLFDGILIAVMLFSALLAMMRGFVREVLSIASWVGAAVGAYLLYPHLLPLAREHISDETLAKIVVIAGAFFAVLIVVSYITMRISDFVLDSRIGALDRTLGFLFGAARGLLLVVIAMLFLNWLVPEQNQFQWITQARSRPMLMHLGQRIIAALPADPESEILNRLRNQALGGEDNGALAEGEPSAADPAGTQQPPTYDPGERSGIDRLIESSRPAGQ